MIFDLWNSVGKQHSLATFVADALYCEESGAFFNAFPLSRLDFEILPVKAVACKLHCLIICCNQWRAGIPLRLSTKQDHVDLDH